MKGALALTVLVTACSVSPPPANPIPSTALVPTSVVTGQPGAPGIGDPLYPLLGNGGYDVVEYELTIAVDPEAGSIEARAGIAATATQDLSSFNLDLAGLEVLAVEVDGSPVEFRREQVELVVALEAGIPAGEDFGVEVEYRGVPVARRASPVFGAGWLRTEDGFFVFNEPFGASTWFPANDHPLDRAAYDLQLEVPAGLQVVSAGEMTSDQIEGGRRKIRWVQTEPTATYLIPLAAGEFSVAETTGPGGIPIRVYASPEFSATELGAFDLQDEMLGFFSETFGPYPYESYGALIVDAPDFHAALETQSLSTFASGSLAAGQVVVAHELAHQWFGNSVGLSRWSDIWLNEGFATFAQWLWAEEREGKTAYDGLVAEAYGVMSGRTFVEEGLSPEAAAASARRAFSLPASPDSEDLFNASVYLRGGLTLVALRDLVGDDLFFGVTRSYYDRHQRGYATTSDLVAASEKVTGRQLDDFFSAWLEDEVIPSMPGRDLEPLS